jgi:hypothetical protein
MANTLKFGNGKWYGKKDTILAYNDENSNYKPLPFNFSRASSATVINKDGLIETVGSDMPRIDYKDDSEGALLLEPQRTNIIVQSNQFDTTWSATNLTVISGQTGVGGSVDAWKLNLTDVNSRVQYNISTSGQKSFSIYAKAGTLDFIRLFAAGGGNPSVFFNLSNGTVSSQDVEVNSANIKNIGNGWYRCEMVYNETISSVRIYPAIADGDISQTSGDIYIQYAQLEEGSYATSYIPTQGGAVTRLADSCNNGGNDQVINSTEGVLYSEISASISSDFKSLSLSDGSSNGDDNRVMIGFQNSILYANVRVGNVYQFNENLTMPINNKNKIALKYKANDFSLWVNGNEVRTSGSGSTFSDGTLKKIQFADGRPTTSVFDGNVKDLRVYNTALTDQELQALTR